MGQDDSPGRLHHNSIELSAGRAHATSCGGRRGVVAATAWAMEWSDKRIFCKLCLVETHNLTNLKIQIQLININ